MDQPDRLAEAEKQLRLFVESNGNEPYSAELKQLTDRLGEIRDGLRNTAGPSDQR